eukprot:6473405-Amphidinium_carterae.1
MLRSKTGRAQLLARYVNGMLGHQVVDELAVSHGGPLLHGLYCPRSMNGTKGILDVELARGHSRIGFQARHHCGR